MQKPLILVTGGSGFVGSHLLERLTQKDARVISIDNYFAGSKDHSVLGVEYREGDVSAIDELVPETPLVVYHLAGYARVESSFANVSLVWKSNMDGTFAVLEFCRKRNAKLVYAGSSTKFSDGGKGREMSPYAWSKATAADLICNYGQWYGLSFAIAYFYNVYGPRERSTSHHGTLIETFAEQFRKGEPLTVVSPGIQRRNFTHVDDIVDGLLLVGEKGKGDGYALGAEPSYSVLEVAQLFGGEIRMLPQREGNRMDAPIDLSKSAALGWRAHRDLPSYVVSLKKAGTGTQGGARGAGSVL